MKILIGAATNPSHTQTSVTHRNTRPCFFCDLKAKAALNMVTKEINITKIAAAQYDPFVRESNKSFTEEPLMVIVRLFCGF